MEKTFEEIHTARMSATLPSLMDEVGLSVERRSIPHLTKFLSSKEPSYEKVWSLKRALALRHEQGGWVIHDKQVLEAYGFAKCKTMQEVERLKGIYWSFFWDSTNDPFALEEACNKGQIYSFLEGFGVDLGLTEEERMEVANVLLS